MPRHFRLALCYLESVRSLSVFALVLTFGVASAQDIELKPALSRGPFPSGGRTPLPTDPVLDSIINGTWVSPDAGADWTLIEPKDGVYTGRPLSGGYIYVPFEASADGTVLLEASGHTMVYVNGAPRAGDPYSWGWLTLPISVKKGRNELLFQVGRGRLKFEIKPVVKPVELDLRDATLPDILPSDKGSLLAGIVVRNATNLPLKGLKINGKAIPTIPAESIRKVPVSLTIPKRASGESAACALKLTQGSKVLHETTIPVRFRTATQTHKRTFVSAIDGSVQYYAVNPAQKPAKTNLLALSVHGASVEASGQSDAYGSKDDITIVCPTNRRPFGFDWEDWGRMDALEVLSEAKRTILHDPLAVHLTGHSMGGHGTWALGTLFPDKFASIAPCASWISFWTYAGGWTPREPNAVQSLVRRSMNNYDTLARLTNTSAQAVYIWHGDADETVPVSQARTMKAELEKIGHPDLGYGEKPGGSHWFGGESVDYAPLFDMMRRRKLNPTPNKIDFTTPNPRISSKAWWASIDSQIEPLSPSRIVLTKEGNTVLGKTTNVLSLSFETDEELGSVVLDGQAVLIDSKKVGKKYVAHLVNAEGKWREGVVKSPVGPLKEVLSDRFALVVGTKGTAEERAWAANKARFDAETWYVRGNGAVDILTDKENTGGRSLMVYGNADTNSVWKARLSKAFDVRGNYGEFQNFRFGPGVTALIHWDGAVGIGGTDLKAMRRTDRLPLFTAGVSYPDWTLIDGEGFLRAGFYGSPAASR